MTCVETSLHLTLEVSFPGCYDGRRPQLNICTPTMMDKKLIFPPRIFIEIESRKVIEKNKRLSMEEWDMVNMCQTMWATLVKLSLLRTFVFY